MLSINLHADFYTPEYWSTWVFQSKLKKSFLMHKIKTGHDVSMDNFSVLSQESTPPDVSIQESLLIS